MTLRKTEKGYYIGSVLPAHGYDSVPDIDGLTRFAVRNLVCQLPRGQTTVSSEDVIKYIESFGRTLTETQKRTIANKIKAILNGCAEKKIDRTSYVFNIGTGNRNFVHAPEGSDKQYIVANDSPLKKIKIIPDQLKDAKFIVLFPRSKLPYGASRLEDGSRVFYYAGYQEPALVSWDNDKYQYTYAEMQSLLASQNYVNYNYGIVNTSYLVLDCDKYELISELCPEFENLMQSTFTVRSGRDSSVGYHLYFICDDIPDFATKKLSLVDKDTNDDLGDVRLHGKFFTVAPHSIHPDTGNEYSVSSNAPVRKITWDEFTSVIGNCIKENHIPKKVFDAASQYFAKAKSNTDSKFNGIDPIRKLGITCLDVLKPVNAYCNGQDYIGAHPVHGSETGHNLAVKADGSAWFCFRHYCGGGLPQAIAVAYDIRDCGDLSRPFTKDEWQEIDSIIQELDPDHFDAYKQAGLENYRAKKRVQELSEIDNDLDKFTGVL